MKIIRGPSIAGCRIQLVDTAPGQTILTGSVWRSPQGDGLTLLDSLGGIAGIEKRLPNPPFTVGSISARIVDALLELNALIFRLRRIS